MELSFAKQVSKLYEAPDGIKPPRDFSEIMNSSRNADHSINNPNVKKYIKKTFKDVFDHLKKISGTSFSVLEKTEAFALDYIQSKFSPYAAFFDKLPPPIEMKKTPNNLVQFILMTTSVVDIINGIKKILNVTKNNGYIHFVRNYGESIKILTKQTHLGKSNNVIFEKIIQSRTITQLKENLGKIPDMVAATSLEKSFCEEIVLSKISHILKVGSVELVLEERTFTYKPIGASVKHFFKDISRPDAKNFTYFFMDDTLIPITHENLQSQKKFPVIKMIGDMVYTMYMHPGYVTIIPKYVKPFSSPLMYDTEERYWSFSKTDVFKINEVDAYFDQVLPLQNKTLKLDFPFCMTETDGVFGVKNIGHFYGINVKDFQDVLHIHVSQKYHNSMSENDYWNSQEDTQDQNPIQKNTYENSENNSQIDIQLVFEEGTVQPREFPFKYPKNLNAFNILTNNLLDKNLQILSVTKIKDKKIYEFENINREKEVFDIIQAGITQTNFTEFEKILSIFEQSKTLDTANQINDILNIIYTKNLVQNSRIEVTQTHEGVYYVNAFRESDKIQIWFRVSVEIQKNREQIQLKPYSKEYAERVESENNLARYDVRESAPKSIGERKILEKMVHDISKKSVSAYFAIYYLVSKNQKNNAEQINAHYMALLLELQKYSERVNTHGFNPDYQTIISKISKNMNDYFEECQKTLPKKIYITPIMFTSLGRFLLRLAQACHLDAISSITLKSKKKFMLTININTSPALLTRDETKEEKTDDVLQKILDLKSDDILKDDYVNINAKKTSNGFKIRWVNPPGLHANNLDLTLALNFWELLGYDTNLTETQMSTEFPIISKIKATARTFQSKLFYLAPKDSHTNELSEIYTEHNPKTKKHKKASVEIGPFLYYLNHVIKYGQFDVGYEKHKPDDEKVKNAVSELINIFLKYKKMLKNLKN